MTKNLKESYYQISADSFVKYKIACDFRVEIMSKWISKNFIWILWIFKKCKKCILVRFWVKVFVSQDRVQAEITVN